MTLPTKHLLIHSFIFLAILICLPASGQGGEYPKTIDYNGTKVEIATIPTRVIAFDLAALDILDALNIDVIGVPSGAKNWPEYLSKYQDAKYTVVGTLFEPDLEVIKTLSPDLILVGGRSRSSTEDLSKIAPTLDLSTTTQSFLPSVVENILTIGTIFDKEKEASIKARELLNKTRTLHKLAQTQGTGALLFSVGENISVHLPNTRFGIVYELAGIHPIIAAEAPITGEHSGGRRSTKDNTVSPSANQLSTQERAERAHKAKAELTTKMAQSPNWLFVLDRNSAFGERANSHELLSKNSAVTDSDAWKNNRVVHLNGSGWYLIGGGVTQLLLTIDQLEAAFSNAPSNNP